MGGTIDIESEPGEGSTFRFTMELGVAGTEDALTEGGLTETFGSYVLSGVEGETVLVGEDHDLTRRVVVEALEAAGAETIVCETEVEARTQVEAVRAGERSFGLVIVDDRLPGGRDLAEAIREQWGPSEMGLIRLSTVEETSASLAGEVRLVKPFTEQELGRKIESALGETALNGEPGAERDRARDEQDQLGRLPGDGALADLVGEVRPTERTAEPSDNDRRAGTEDYLQVLVAEDNAVNQSLIERLLEAEGHGVVVAENGAETVAAYKEAVREGWGFDLVLMDVQMPKLSGLEATKRIRALEAEEDRENVPIVALTARVLEADRKKCLEAGMDEYLSKPIERTELQSILEETLRDKSSRRDGSTAEESSKDDASGEESSEKRTSGGALEGAGGKKKAVLDEKTLLRRVGRDPECLREVVEEFLEEGPAQAEAIERALAQEDAQTVSAKAHSLKGTAGSLQSEAVRTAAARLEEMGRREDLEGARPVLEQLETALDQLQSRLLSLTEEVPSEGADRR